MIGIGVIGCGRISQLRHIPEYAKNPEAELVGFCAMNSPARAEAMAKQYGGKVYGTVEEMLADPKIQAVSVCTANATHAELTIRALNAGKHVLCEKPMATTVAECEAMVEAAKRNGKFLMIAQNQRLDKVHLAAKKLLDEGLIGKVISFRTIFGHGGPETWSIEPGSGTWFFDKSRAVIGAMGDLGIHKTDLIQHLLGQRVVRVTAKLTTLDKCYADGTLIGVDDNAFCIYEMSGGAVGTMTASWSTYGGLDDSVVLYGTKGILRVYEDPEKPLQAMLADGTRMSWDVKPTPENSGIIDQWMECILQNKEPEISGESALQAMRAVLASVESSETGAAVEIPENR